MVTVTNEVNSTCIDFEEEVFQECTHCHQTYLVKYWDAELDWYIQVNNSDICRDCAKDQPTVFGE